MFTFGLASCAFFEGPDVVSEGSVASWIKWLILNVMLAAPCEVGNRNKSK